MIDLTLLTSPVLTMPRKLSASWTIDMKQDLKVMSGIVDQPKGVYYTMEF